MSQVEDIKGIDDGEKKELFSFNYQQSAAEMSPARDDEPAKSSRNVLEMRTTSESVKQRRAKRVDRLSFLESHASLFHAIRSATKSIRQFGEHEGGITLKVAKCRHVDLGASEEEVVIKEDLALAQESQDTESAEDLSKSDLLIPDMVTDSRDRDLAEDSKDQDSQDYDSAREPQALVSQISDLAKDSQEADWTRDLWNLGVRDSESNMDSQVPEFDQASQDLREHDSELAVVDSQAPDLNKGQEDHDLRRDWHKPELPKDLRDPELPQDSWDPYTWVLELGQDSWDPDSLNPGFGKGSWDVDTWDPDVIRAFLDSGSAEDSEDSDLTKDSQDSNSQSRDLAENSQDPDMTKDSEDLGSLDPNSTRDSQDPDLAKDAQDPGSAKDSRDQDLAKDSQDQDLAKDSRDPGSAKDSQDQDLAKDSRDPGSAKDSQDPGSAKDSQDRDLAKDSRDPGSAKDSQDPGLAKDSQDRDLAKGSRDPDSAKDSRDPGSAKDSQDQDLAKVQSRDQNLAKESLEDTDMSAAAPSSQSKLKGKSVTSRMQQRRYLIELPPAHLLPYLVLIKRVMSLPVSAIQKQCLSGEILCRIQYFTLKLQKRKLRSRPVLTEQPTHRLPTVRGLDYVTFDCLRDLQWKLYKGIAKRKPKTIGVERKSSYSHGVKGTTFAKFTEYVLPLIPKGWIIDDSLKFSENMVVLLAQNKELS